MATKDAGLRKRQQIENAGRKMFLWIAIAAALVSVAAVVSYSLWQQLVFNQKVIGRKQETVSNLRHNNEIVDKLKDETRVLNTNSALGATPRLDGAEPITVILDALPAQANSAAFGASLEQKLLSVGGVTIESSDVTPAAEEGSGEASTSETAVGENQIAFQFTVRVDSAQVGKLKDVLTNLQRSIRPVMVTSITIERQSNQMTMDVEGHTVYAPAKKVELTEKSERP